MNFLENKLNKIINLNKKNEAELVHEKEILKQNEYNEKVEGVHNSEIPKHIKSLDINLNYQHDFSDVSLTSLHDKVMSFYKWYYKKIIKNYYKKDEYDIQKEKVERFIEKMAS